MSKTKPEQGSLHDWLRLGEIELALSPDHQGHDDEGRRREQIHRLPLLLRLLSGSQPLASVPLIGGKEKCDETEESPSDDVIDGVVSRLEDVAASYSAAESVDALVNLAPSVSRKIARTPPLKRVYSRTENRQAKRKWDGWWDTRDLVAASSSGRRKRRRMSEHVKSEDAGASDEIVAEEDESDYDTSVDIEEESKARQQKSKSSPTTKTENESPQNSQAFLVGASVAVEDSQESMVNKTLSEVVSLVVESLKPVSSSGEDSGENEIGTVALAVTSDSLLMEAVDSVGAIGGSDLGATIVALMHNAPVLRHRHVANALCRTASPQTADLVARMAANCPDASPCLVKGCIDAYRSAYLTSPSTNQRSRDLISSAATSAVRAIARLSQVETGRVVALLQGSNGVMVDLLLELCVTDPSLLASLLIRHLSVASPTAQTSSVAPIRQRNKSAFRRIRPRYPSHQNYAMPSLQHLLQKNPSLVCKSCCSIAKALVALRSNGNMDSWGNTALLLHAYSLLMARLHLSSKISDSPADETKLAKGITTELHLLANKMSKLASQTETASTSSKMDRCYQLLVSSCLLTNLRFYKSHDVMSIADREELEKLLRTMLVSSVSIKSDVFTARVAGFLCRSEVTELLNLIIGVIEGDRTGREALRSVDSASVARLEEIAGSVVSNEKFVSASHLGALESSILVDASAVVDSIKAGDMHPSELRDILRNLLHDPTKCKALIESRNAGSLITEGVVLLSKHQEPNLPLVTEMDLDMLASKITWQHECGSLSLDAYAFVLQVYYCLTYSELEPDSPFCIDPQQLPQRQLICACEILAKSRRPTERTFGVEFEGMLGRHFPGIASNAQCPMEASCCIPCTFNQIGKTSHRAIKEMLSSSVLACLDGGGIDPSGVFAERAYLVAQMHLPFSEVDATTVAAMLRTRNSPLPYFTYGMLCRDPLVVLKCPCSIFMCQGLRRMALSILNRLLKANDAIVNRLSRAEETATELIMARNMVIVRCLITSACGGSPHINNGALHCSMTWNLVRLLVAKQPGIIAMLIKQGVPDEAVDWIVECVPEALENSAGAFTALLSEKDSQTAADRLKTADAALRIALTHGSGNDVDVRTLVYVCLSVMVSSFFLVIGPLGVPVNVLCQEGDLDVTQIFRRAFFSMLNTLRKANVRDPSVRRECAIALQKIMGMCKSDTILSGVTGIVATRRKNLLKEIWEAVMSATNSIAVGA